MVQVSDIIDIVNTNIGDDSNDRVTENDRLNAITEATAWLQEELGNDHQKKVHPIQYNDIKNVYRLDDDISDIVNATDLRSEEDGGTDHFVFKSASDVLHDAKNGSSRNSYGIDRYNGRSYLAINYHSGANSETIDPLDSTDDWTVDDDAVNLSTDDKEVKEGARSLVFDVDVSASANDKATIKSSNDIDPADLTPYEDLGTFFLWVYIPDAVDITSVDLVFGTDASNYWLESATTDTQGADFSDGWNLVEFNWKDASSVGSPDPTDVSYYEMTINYDGTQVDDTGFRFDGLQITLTEKLTLHYTSYHVGEDSAGSNINSFSATDDVPFFSGQYDQYKFPVAHKAASFIYDDLRLTNQATRYDNRATSSLDRYRNLFPTHKKHEVGSFKAAGLNFNN